MDFNAAQSKAFFDVAEYLAIVGTANLRLAINEELTVYKLKDEMPPILYNSFLDEMRHTIDTQSADIKMLSDGLRDANDTINDLIRAIEATQQFGSDSLYRIKNNRGIY